MPNTRDSSATTMNQPVRQLQDMSSAMSTMTWPADRLTNLTAIATHSLTATYALWSELIENQRRFTVRLLDAMRVSAKAQTQPPQSSGPSLVGSIVDIEATPSKSEFPIKRYDSLTVQEITGKLDRLRDQRSIRIVLAYEAKNKARKGIAAAGEARLKRLSDS